MVKQTGKNDYVIIGEAGLNLALGEKEINICSVFKELSCMARNSNPGPRLAHINQARNLLVSFNTLELAVLQRPFLQKLSDLNDDIS